MTSMICPTCGQNIPASSLENCPYCSVPLALQSLSSPPFSPAETFSLSPFSETPASGTGAGPLLSQAFPASSAPGSFGRSLPFWRRWFSSRMPSRSTTLQGIVVSLRTQQEDTHHRNSLSSFLAQTMSVIREIVWPRAETQSSSPKRTVTMIRVRAPGGFHRDIRMEGEPGGAMLAEGDNVSFSGHYRRGIFVARQGYNHTSEADIYQRSSGASTISSLVILALVIVALLVALSRLHIVF